MRILAATIVLLVSLQSAWSQNLSYYRSIVDTLTSEYFSGRAYHDDGAEKASRFIAGEFEKMGLRPFGNSYVQEFTLNINTIQTARLSFDGNTLELGKDYIVSSQSRSAVGDLPVVLITQDVLTDEKKQQKFLSESYRNKVVVFDSKTYHMLKKLPASYFKHVRQASAFVELVDGELVASMSQNQSMNPYFLLKRDAFPKKTKKADFDVSTKFYRDYVTQNVVATMGEYDSSLSDVIVCAHYDHVGELGNGVWIQGANDNASGTSMMLDLASELSKLDSATVNFVFIGFGAEEVGLLGSQYFCENPLVDLSKVKLVLNLDLMGSGSKGVTVVNAFDNEDAVGLLEQINADGKYVPEIVKRKNAANSDHFPFTEKGVNSIFMYTMGEVGGYHDIHDSPDDLEYDYYEKVFGLVRDFLKVLN